MPGPQPAAPPGGQQPASQAPALAKQAAASDEPASALPEKQAAASDEPASALPELRPPGAPRPAPYAAEGGALPQAAVCSQAPGGPEAAPPQLPHAPPLSHTKPVSSYDRPMQYRGPMSPWTLPLSPSAGRSYASGWADSNSIGGVRPQLPSIPGLPSSVCIARLASVPNQLSFHPPPLPFPIRVPLPYPSSLPAPPFQARPISSASPPPCPPCPIGTLCVNLFLVDRAMQCVDRAMQCAMHTLRASSGGPQSCAAPVARLPIQVHL